MTRLSLAFHGAFEFEPADFSMTYTAADGTEVTVVQHATPSIHDVAADRAGPLRRRLKYLRARERLRSERPSIVVVPAGKR